MPKRTLTILISLILLSSLGIYKVSAQELPPPLSPPYILYGIAYVDGNRLDHTDTEYTVSIHMARLLLIFLNTLDSQGRITNIVNELDSHQTAALRDEFANSNYCQSRVPPTELSLNASVATEVLGNKWTVTDVSSTYTVEREDIPVWDPVLGWIQGDKLAVNEHNGIIASYTMGENPDVGDNYLMQILMDSETVLWGPEGNTYLLREPGKAIPGEAYVYINDIRGGTEPESTASFIIGGQENFVEMGIYAPSTYTVNIDLLEDWNLISFPVQPLDTTPSIVLQSIIGQYDAIYKYDPGNNLWIFYDPTKPLLSFLDKLEAKVGYWIKMKIAARLTVEGTLVEETEVDLVNGWNLVGYCALDPKDIEQCMSSLDGYPDLDYSVYEYDPENDIWIFYDPNFLIISTLQYMAFGKGYWIKTDQTGIWDINQ